MTNEIWKDVNGYEGFYQISSMGNVRSLKGVNHRVRNFKGRLLKKMKNGKGYLHISLYINRKPKTVTVHKLVANAFIGDSNGLHVNHIDGDKFNNNILNLEYVSNRENATHGRNSTGLVGASWCKKMKKWRSTIEIKGKQEHLGFYNTELEAHEVYMKQLKKHNLTNKYAREQS